jgi:hypothetical protein
MLNSPQFSTAEELTSTLLQPSEPEPLEQQLFLLVFAERGPNFLKMLSPSLGPEKKRRNLPCPSITQDPIYPAISYYDLLLHSLLGN